MNRLRLYNNFTLILHEEEAMQIDSTLVALILGVAIGYALARGELKWQTGEMKFDLFPKKKEDEERNIDHV